MGLGVFWFGVCLWGFCFSSVCGGGYLFCFVLFFFQIIVNAQDFSVDTALGSLPFLTGKGLSLRIATKFLSL